MENQKFEESFKEAFNEAEVNPSESVWTGVELDLEKASGGEMKRKLLFFQLLAAASMVFALGIGSIYFLNSGSSEVQQLANRPTVEQTPTDNNPAWNPIEEVNSLPATAGEALREKNNVIPKRRTRKGERKGNSTFIISSVNPPSVFSRKEDTGSEPFLIESKQFQRRGNTLVDRKPESKLVNAKKPSIVIPVSEPDAGLLLLARLEADEQRLNKETKKEMNERTWASVGFGAGSFTPQAGSSAPAAQKSLGVTSGGGGTKMSSSNPSSGASYSFGVSMSGRVAKRIVLQGGVSYLNQNAEFTSSSAVGQKASLNELAVTSDDLIPTSPYKVNSNLQYLSVPMQAGYLLLDRNLGIQLNGGISTDLFLQNTLTPTDKSLSKVTQGAGSDSPYRTVSFSGLVGTEFSYKVADHYRIAVSPGFRYALNSIYKSDIETELSPMTFDVSVRFRYIF